MYEQMAAICESRERRPLDQGADPDRRRRQGVRLRHRHLAIPRLQDRRRTRSTMRRGSIACSARWNSVRVPIIAADCRRLHRRRGRDRGLLRHPASAPRRRGSAFPIARARWAIACRCRTSSRLASLIGPARTKDLIFTARLVRGARSAGARPAQRSGARRRNAAAPRRRNRKLVAGHAPITLEVTKEAVRRIRRTLSRDEGGI